jgi:hypothetical protein
MPHLLYLFALLFLSLPAAAQDWTTSTKILVKPGLSVGSIVLGRPLPDNVASLYGTPTSTSEPLPGADGMDTGSVVFGSTDGFELRRGLLVKLNDGNGDQNVYSIYAKGVRAYTAEGVTAGMSMARARAIYPQASQGIDDMTGEPTLRIPGLLMLFANDRLTEMVVRRK